MGLFSVPNQINPGDPTDANKAMANWNQVPNDLNAAIFDHTNASPTAGFTADQLADAAKLGLSGASTTRRGATIIATTESRTNVAYGLLTTPDRVSSVAVPANAIVRVYYQATWQESIAGAGNAALFIGANQLQAIGTASDNVLPSVQAAAIGVAAKDQPLVMSPIGLVSTKAATTGYTSDPTTGVAQAVFATGIGPDNVIVIGTGVTMTGPAALGGGLVIDNLAANTYDFTVQFKSTSGSVTVKNRRLKVIVEGF